MCIFGIRIDALAGVPRNLEGTMTPAERSASQFFENVKAPPNSLWKRTF